LLFSCKVCVYQQFSKRIEYMVVCFTSIHVLQAGGGTPSRNAVRELLEKMDADEEWYPGKSYQESFGPAPALSAVKRRAIAQSAMALKNNGSEPTYALVLAQCPRAALNPATGEPVGKKRIYDIMREDCYDGDPEDRWLHIPRLQKKALPEAVQQKRLAWGEALLQEDAGVAGWCCRHIVWTDLCNDILPRTQAKATEQALARKGNRGWMGKKSQGYSVNLKGKDAFVEVIVVDVEVEVEASSFKWKPVGVVRS
jgi:hypothetical protein